MEYCKKMKEQSLFEGSFLFPDDTKARPKRGGLLKRNDVVVNNKNTYKGKDFYQIVFSKQLRSELKPYKFVNLYKSKITPKAFFVFNNESGAHVSIGTLDKTTPKVSQKHFVKAVCDFIGVNKEFFRIRISGNMSDNDEFRVYEIIK